MQVRRAWHDEKVQALGGRHGIRCVTRGLPPYKETVYTGSLMDDIATLQDAMNSAEDAYLHHVMTENQSIQGGTVAGSLEEAAYAAYATAMGLETKFEDLPVEECNAWHQVVQAVNDAIIDGDRSSSC